MIHDSTLFGSITAVFAISSWNVCIVLVFLQQRTLNCVVLRTKVPFKPVIYYAIVIAITITAHAVEMKITNTKKDLSHIPGLVSNLLDQISAR